jgi:SurA N-terminal domain
MSRLLASVVLAAAVAVVASCGDARRTPAAKSPTAVVVAGTKITQATVQHWMHALSLSGARQRRLRNDESPRQRIVSFLITTRWMIDEAHRRGLGVTRADVDQALEQQENVYTAHSEFTDLLKESGRTVADLRLELEAELAFTALRRLLAPYLGKTTASSRRVLGEFLTSWTRRWKAQTDCRPGYIVDSCRQHPGPVAIEYPISVDL